MGCLNAVKNSDRRVTLLVRLKSSRETKRGAGFIWLIYLKKLHLFFISQWLHSLYTEAQFLKKSLRHEHYAY